MYKALTPVIAVIMLVWSGVAHAQTGIATQMVNCIEAMDISRLSGHFAREMEISINGDGGMLSAEEARIRIYTFLTEKGVVACNITHNGDRQTSGFCILSLKTSDGGTYRIYSFYKKDNEQTIIQQFRIDYDG